MHISHELNVFSHWIILDLRNKCLVAILNDCMLLFKVDERFMVTGRGLILMPGLGDKKARPGDSIKIVRPDETIIETTIRGIGFNEFREILVGKGLTKEDIPIGSEVWLNNEG